MLLGAEVYLGLRDIVFDVDPDTPEKKGTPTPTQFLAHVYCGQMAGWMKTPWCGSRPRPRPYCTRRGPSSCERGTAPPPIFGPFLLWPRSPISATSTELLLHQIFNVSALLLDDALKPATPLIAPLISGIAGLSASSSSKTDTLNI